MAERGPLYLWPRNRSFGDSKPRPIVVIAPDAATSQSRRWVVLPTTVAADQLEGPLGRLGFHQMAAILRSLAEALDLQLLEPRHQDP